MKLLKPDKGGQQNGSSHKVLSAPIQLTQHIGRYSNVSKKASAKFCWNFKYDDVFCSLLHRRWRPERGVDLDPEVGEHAAGGLEEAGEGGAAGLISITPQLSSPIKDDTLPCKCQALAWKNEPKAWIQGFQALKFFFGCIVFLLLYIS